MKRKTMLIGVGILAAGVLGTVSAFAATTGLAGATGSSTQNIPDTQNMQGMSNAPGVGMPSVGAPGEPSAPSARHQRAHFAFAGANIASILGISPQTLKSDLQQGQSLAKIAQSKGISEQTLIDDIESAQKKKLDQAVQNGKLTAAQEQKILSKMDTRIPKLVEQSGTLGGLGNHKRVRGAFQAAGIQDLTSVLGIDKATLRSDLRNGESILEIAQSKGISEQTLVSSLKNNLETKLDKAVQSGKLTKTQENTILQKFGSNIDNVLNHKGSFGNGLGANRNQADKGQTNTNSTSAETTLSSITSNA